jgi:hypothetical protein
MHLRAHEKRLKLETKAKRGETKKLRKALAIDATGAEGDWCSLTIQARALQRVI